MTNKAHLPLPVMSNKSNRQSSHFIEPNEELFSNFTTVLVPREAALGSQGSCWSLGLIQQTGLNFIPLSLKTPFIANSTS